MLKAFLLFVTLNTYAAEVTIQCEGSQYQLIVNEETANNYTLIFTDKTNGENFETTVINDGVFKIENDVSKFEFNKGFKKFLVHQDSHNTGGEIRFIIKKFAGKDIEEICNPRWLKKD